MRDVVAVFNAKLFKDFCAAKECDDCPFQIGDFGCRLNCRPVYWNLKNLEDKTMNNKITKLTDTIDLMQSENYKDRFRAEYYQTKIRYDRLHKVLIQYEAGTLPFDLKCSSQMLRDLANFMGQYLRILEIRAEIERIDLSFEEDIEHDQ